MLYIWINSAVNKLGCCVPTKVDSYHSHSKVCFNGISLFMCSNKAGSYRCCEYLRVTNTSNVVIVYLETGGCPKDFPEKQGD